MNLALDELIQAALDGSATPGERTRLEDLLRRDPEARRRHDEMRGMFQALRGDLPRSAPPPDLRDAVLAALPARGAAASPRAGWRIQRLVFPLATAAVALAIVWFALRTTPSPLAPDARTVGTMSGAAPQAIQFELALAEGAVRIAASRDEKGAAWLEIATDAATRVTLASVSGSIEFQGAESPSEENLQVPAMRDHLEWYLKSGVTLRVRCKTTDPAPLVSVRASDPGHDAGEFRIALESLPTVRTQ